MKFVYSSLLLGLVAAAPQIYQSCTTDNDADNDGYDSTSSGGSDCNDSDATVYPGAPEYCDNLDNDCDGASDEEAVNADTYYIDEDGDGVGGSQSVASCDEVPGASLEGGDCDDTNATLYPGAEERVGDGVDSNCNGHQDLVDTIAGNNTSGFSGDNGAATSAQLNNPYNVAEGPDGSLYISDSANHRIRRVDPSGKITTFAGTGVAGFSGDGGSAASAQLNYPRGLAIDSAGMLYVADSSNQRVRVINLSSGQINTLAGNGVAAYSGDGGAASAATLNYPYGLGVDDTGRVLIADSNNHRVRRVGADGVISTVAGNGTAGFSGDGAAATAAQLNFPRSVAFDGSGNLYIADTSNYRIRKVVSTGVISTIAGSGVDGYSGDNGAATAAKLNDCYGISVDVFDNLYIADTDNHRVRMVDLPSGNIYTVVGSGVSGYSGDDVEGGSTAARLNVPYTVTVLADDSLAVADTRNYVIRRVWW